jgi:hypothetical protein
VLRPAHDVCIYGKPEHGHGLYDDYTLWEKSVWYTSSDLSEEPIFWQVSTRLCDIISYKWLCSMLHPFARHFYFPFLFCSILLDKITGKIIFRLQDQLRWRRSILLFCHRILCFLFFSFHYTLRYSVHVLGLRFPSFLIIVQLFPLDIFWFTTMHAITLETKLIIHTENCSLLVITQRVVVISCQRFGKIYQSKPQGSWIQKESKGIKRDQKWFIFEFLHPEDGTEKLSRKVCKELPLPDE